MSDWISGKTGKPNVKSFDGEVYRLHDLIVEKREANKEAKSLRKRGCKARLVKAKGVDPFTHKHPWLIYKRCS